jgi:teichuronic acid biosynthesis glycosyltransferase TuaG
MKQPLISVIMPAHNTERFIGAAIESVLAQTYENWELLVIDDASTDGTGQVVRRFSDTRIKYHRCERIFRTPWPNCPAP